MSDLGRQMQQGFDRDAVHQAVLAVAATVEPDGQYDPGDDPRPSAAMALFADLLGNVSSREVAEGVYAALGELWQRWFLEQKG